MPGAHKPSRPKWEEAFVTWLKEDWLMKLGALLVLLGMGWFLSYAIAQGWIGEMGRIGIGFIVGTLVLLLGRYRITRFAVQGGILMFTGALIIVLTLWAGRELYGFFTPISALAVMFLASAVLGLTSVLFDRISLAYGNVALAAAAPLLVASPEPSVVGLLGYLLVLAAGAVTIVAFTGWRQLILASLVVTFLYSMPFLVSPPANGMSLGLLLSFLFTALYFAMSIVGMRHSARTQVYDVVTGALAGLFLLVWVLVAAAEAWQSSLLAVWAVVFAGGAFLAYRNRADMRYFLTYIAVALILLGSATATLLSGPALTLALTLEAAALLVVGHLVARGRVTLLALGLPSVIPLLLSLENIGSRTWYTGVLHGDAAVLTLIMAVAALVGTYFMMQSTHSSSTEKEQCRVAAAVAWGLAGVYALILVWLVAHALIASTDVATTVALIIYTVAASVLYIGGKFTTGTWERVVAGLLISGVMIRLLLYEVWEMELLERVVTFLVIGVLLMAVAWFERSNFITHKTPKAK
jgi:uncharacterized membrane protein